MPTVSSMTLDRLLELEASTIVSGLVDSNQHLILVQHDGTQVDAGVVMPPASTTERGSVQLATPAEVLAGTNALKAVTPLGVAGLPPGVKVVSGIAESASSASWPLGISVQSVTSGSAWTPNNGFGTIVNTYLNSGRVQQWFFASAGGSNFPLTWTRTNNAGDGGGGWTAWQQVDITVNLVSGSFTQTTSITSYPPGYSRLYFSGGASGWDFGSKAGEVFSYKNGDFIRQTWTKHQSGTSGDTEVWVRTGNAGTGWSRWKALAEDKVDVAWTNLSYASGYTAGSAGQLQYRVKNGVIYWRGGATGTFTEGAYSVVASVNAVPTAYRPAQPMRGGATGTGMRGCGWELNTDGAVRFGWQALSSAPTWIAFSTSYPLDT